MNKTNTTCRVCGKEYFCCSDSRDINSWRAMACSPDCFKEYMRRIEKSRKPIVEEKTSNTVITETRVLDKTSKTTKKKFTNEIFKTEDIVGD